MGLLSRILEGLSTPPNKYDEYLENHRRGVYKACCELESKFSDNPAFEGVDWRVVKDNCLHHDDSKYSEVEYEPYNVHFYGTRTPETEKEYDYAWNHHQKTNPHHSQYWVLIRDEGELLPVDMPINYIVEMLCDWWSFSINEEDSVDKLKKWYAEEGPKKLMSEQTRKRLEGMLEALESVKVEERLKNAPELVKGVIFTSDKEIDVPEYKAVETAEPLLSKLSENEYIYTCPVRKGSERMHQELAEELKGKYGNIRKEAMFTLSEYTLRDGGYEEGLDVVKSVYPYYYLMLYKEAENIYG